MPMPDSKILSAFLEHYYSVKKDQKKDTLFGMALNVGQLVGVVANHAEERKPKTEDIAKKIADAKTTEAWIEIALECGVEARAGQAAKRLGGDSDYAKAMHAMRSYIIDALAKDHKLSPTLQTAIQKRLSELNGDPSIINNDDPKKIGLRETYYRNMGKGYDISPSKKLYIQKLIELADLGDIRSCSEATTIHGATDLSLYDPKVFETLKYKNKLNINIPICYQPIYHFVYYLEEGMKAGTKKLPGNKGEVELNFRAYITYLKNHQPNDPDVIDSELLQNDNDGDDFEDGATDLASSAARHSGPAQSPARQPSKAVATRPIAPRITQQPSLPNSNSSDEGDVSELATPFPAPPLKKFNSTPKQSVAFFPSDDGSLYPRHSSVSSAPQLGMPSIATDGQNDGDTTLRAPSISLKRSGEYDS